MWFNSKQREEPYQVLTSSDVSRDGYFLRDTKTGGAWLSSARVVRCWVKSRNERNPYLQLLTLRVRTLKRLPGTTRRKVGTTSNHHAPYDLGYTRNTMVINRGKQSREAEQIPKNDLSSDRRLQPACVKLELLVIADQHAAVNTFPGLVHTARHTMGVCNTRSP